MPVDREQRLSRHFQLKQLLIDETFPELAVLLDPSPAVIANLERLTALADQICDKFPPAWEVISGYRDLALNEACRKAGLPASVESLHLSGCAADLKPGTDDTDLEAVFEWIRVEARADLPVHEAVYYPNKGFIHIAVEDKERPTAKRILMRT